MAFNTDDRLQLEGSEAGTGFDEDSLNELSVLELVELIEQEEQLVDAFERNRELGASALLHRVANFSVEQQDAAPALEVGGQTTELLDELHDLIDQLEVVSDQLDQRSACLDQQEIAQADIAAMLLEAQKQLSIRIDQAHASVSEEKRGRRQHTFRRAA
ncbi:hypothetical protein [Thalassoroseus pseudoceratinae]|uniref:hypothetical protein n=1 Tax=Thalassoroseus pseudoceratinae TaxID=2713176 RepID=UPI00141E12A4|nr:hypothetical protein [Thalassoroseus pseudoceratinae]